MTQVRRFVDPDSGAVEFGLPEEQPAEPRPMVVVVQQPKPRRERRPKPQSAPTPPSAPEPVQAPAAEAHVLGVAEVFAPPPKSSLPRTLEDAMAVKTDPGLERPASRAALLAAAGLAPEPKATSPGHAPEEAAAKPAAKMPKSLAEAMAVEGEPGIERPATEDALLAAACRRCARCHGDQPRSRRRPHARLGGRGTRLGARNGPWAAGRAAGDEHHRAAAGHRQRLALPGGEEIIVRRVKPPKDAVEGAPKLQGARVPPPA